MEYIVTTERLGMRHFEDRDSEFLFRLNSDPDVMRFTGEGPFTSERMAARLIKAYDQYERFGTGRWTVCLLDSDEPIGWCGLKTNFEESARVDIGYRFFKKHWNKGYATESAIPCMQYGFDVLQLDEIWGWAMAANPASIRVFEKIGLVFRRNRVWEGHDVVSWSATPADFNRFLQSRQS